MLGLFAAGLALQSLHWGHEILADKAAECECIAADRLDGAVSVLPDVGPATSVEVAPSPPTVPACGRSRNLRQKARAPPLA